MCHHDVLRGGFCWSSEDEATVGVDQTLSQRECAAHRGFIHELEANFLLFDIAHQPRPQMQEVVYGDMIDIVKLSV